MEIWARWCQNFIDFTSKPPDLDSEATIGIFLQLFPLVVNLKQTPTVNDIIQASAKNIFALLEHRRVSLPRLVSQNIRIAAAMMKQPACIFQIIQTNREAKQNRRRPYYIPDAPDFKFNIFIHDSNQYSLNTIYNTSCYGHEYIERLVNQYQQILIEMIANSQKFITAMQK